MSEANAFKIGQQVRLVWEYDGLEYSYSTRIADLDINSLFLYPPEEDWDDYPIERRTEASLFVKLDEGDAEYATVFQGIEEESVVNPRWVVSYPQIRVTSLRHRRHHYRITINDPFWFSMIKDIKRIPIEYPHQGEMVNLSSGGIRGFSPIELKQGDVLELAFAIPPYRVILKANVVMSRPQPPGGRYASEAAMRFVALEGRERDRIARFIMQEQANRRAINRLT